MVLQPLCAGNKDWAKKTAKVAWHTAQTAAGLFLVKNMVRNRCAFRMKPLGGYEYDRRPFTLNPFSVPAKGAHAVKLAATVTLLYSGISGLNEDFQIVKRIKKLKKKSKKVVKK